jgi:ABC-type transporter Mla MlaB component
VQITTTDGGSSLKISGPLQVSEADALRASLLVTAAQSQPATIDLSEVEECDTASLQLLCAARKPSPTSGRRLELRNPSEALLKISSALGLSTEELFGDALKSSQGDPGAL